MNVRTLIRNRWLLVTWVNPFTWKEYVGSVWWCFDAWRDHLFGCVAGLEVSVFLRGQAIYSSSEGQ